MAIAAWGTGNGVTDGGGGASPGEIGAMRPGGGDGDADGDDASVVTVGGCGTARVSLLLLLVLLSLLLLVGRLAGGGDGWDLNEADGVDGTDVAIN